MVLGMIIVLRSLAMKRYRVWMEWRRGWRVVRRMVSRMVVMVGMS